MSGESVDLVGKVFVRIDEGHRLHPLHQPTPLLVALATSQGQSSACETQAPEYFATAECHTSSSHQGRLSFIDRYSRVDSSTPAHW